MQGPPIFNLVLNRGLELAEKFKNISRCRLEIRLSTYMVEESRNQKLE